MPRKRRLSPQSVWDVEEVRSAFEEVGVKEMHIMKLYTYLIRHPEDSWTEVPELPKAAVKILNNRFALRTSKLVRQDFSDDGETVKMLIELQDGLQVESVIMLYDGPVSRRQQRATLCVSSQCGCQMGCTFCATGTMKLQGDLTAGEIVEQLVFARKFKPIRNIVFMGMGEPLNNYAAVCQAIRLFTHPQAFGLRRRSVTVSTVGVIPRIKSLAIDLPGISLALSLHAPTQDLRTTIVPSARAYPLDKLMNAVQVWQGSCTPGSGRGRVFVEYVMLGPDLNCTPEHARQLGSLLQDRAVVVNLIPWNPVLSPNMHFEAPQACSTQHFADILREQFGLRTTVRQEKGQDVSAACGQLALEHRPKEQIVDVEDLCPAKALCV